MRTTAKARSIGERDAKAHLSRLLRDVREGREWVITERDTPIARLSAIADAELSFDERVRRLEETGVISKRTSPEFPLPPPVKLEFGIAQRMLQEDRDG